MLVRESVFVVLVLLGVTSSGGHYLIDEKVDVDETENLGEGNAVAEDRPVPVTGKGEEGEEGVAEQEPAAATADPGTCLNEHCIAASHRLFQSMNLSADPCEDFNEFSCGRFQQEFVLPEDKSRWSSFTPIGEDIYKRGRAILEEDVISSDWPTFVEAKKMYRSCMDEAKLEELGVQPLLSILKELGGWPAVEGDSWAEPKDYHWYEQIYKMSDMGLGKDYVFYLSVGTDDKNSSWRAIFLDQPSLGMAREYLVKGFDDPDVQHYFTYMKDTAALLGADAEKIEDELRETLLFEIKLAELTAPREERRNASKLYNPVIVEDYPSLSGHPPSWTSYINTIISSVEIGPEERIIVSNPDYVKKVAPLLESTDSRVMSNYLAWRVAKSVMSHLNKDARNIRQKFSKAISGLNAEPPRWKTCTGAAGFNSYSDTSLRIPAATMYVKRHFSPEAKNEMISMIRYLRNAFLKILNDLDWMDPKTKSRAENKLELMDQFIAYPDEILDQDIVEEHHKGLSMTEDDYIGNKLQLIKWDRLYKFGRLREKVDKKFWRDHSLVAIVNAFYNPGVNSIEFPAGILQGTFFHHQVPRYMNFGGIGGVIGHEITHGFDDQGRQYDGEGNLKEWWEGDTKEKFIAKAKCIIDQYGNYVNDQVDLPLNGINTQGENIADNGGVKEAFMAYLDWVKDNGEEPKLPGHDFTPRQLFWISWGQVWCSKYRDAAMKKQILTGAHSPGMYRINGPLSNSPEFSAAFNCPVGSAMNRDTKCSVW